MKLTPTQQEVYDKLAALPWDFSGVDRPRVSAWRTTSETFGQKPAVTVEIRAYGGLIPDADRNCEHCGRYDGPSTYISSVFKWENGRLTKGPLKIQGRGPRRYTLKPRLAEIERIIEQGHV